MSGNEKDTKKTDVERESIEQEDARPGVYKPGYKYRKEALDYFRLCVGNEIYERAMKSEAGKQHHYVVARAFLSQSDWEKYVWIEKYGSLVGFY